MYVSSGSAFDSLKKLAEMAILGYNDSNKNYRLYTNASDQSIGVYLSHLV